jgi:hypothetical protein
MEIRKFENDPALINPELLTDTVQQEFHRIVRNAWEEVLKGVLRQYLGREPELEDAKLLTLGTNPNWDYSLLSVDGHSVGKIVQDFKGTSVTVTFVPNEFTLTL